jgi:hypothetical protein
MVMLVAIMMMFVFGTGIEDQDATTETTTAYDVWKVSCAYGTFVAVDGGVEYSPESVDGCTVIYIDNGSLVSDDVGAGWSVVNIHICNDLSLRMNVTVEDRHCLFGTQGMLADLTVYDIYVPDPRILGVST